MEKKKKREIKLAEKKFFFSLVCLVYFIIVSQIDYRDWTARTKINTNIDLLEIEGGEEGTTGGCDL